MSHSAAEHTTPTVRFSVVVPTYKRPDRLVDCLRSLADLRYDRSRFEVVVVDDGSGTLPQVKLAVQPLMDRLPVRLVEQPHAGPAAARNFGAKEARFEYLAFTDDDCRPDPLWLTTLAQRFVAEPDCIAGGQTVNALTDNIYAEASQLLISYIYEYFHGKGAPFFASNNFALSRTLFEALGGFDARFPLAGGEDRDFCARAVQRGCRFAYVDAAIIRHYHALTLRRFTRQHVNYGRGAQFFHRLNAARGGSEITLEPATFYRDLITYPYTVPGIQRRFRLSLLMLLSQGANAVGFFSERMRRLVRVTSC